MIIKEETFPMGSKLTPRNIIIGIVVLWIVASVPVWFLETNPPVTNAVKWDTPQTEALARRACYDCHSNETKWPIYSRIAPSAYLVTFDVMQGRKKLNFSEWGTDKKSANALLTSLGISPRTAYAQKDDDEDKEGAGQEEKGEAAREMTKEIERGFMPPSIYLPLHPEAKLTDAEKPQLIAGIKATFK